MRIHSVAAIALAAVAPLCACSSGNTANAGAGSGSGGGDAAITGHDTNPDGVPYPAGPYGHDQPTGGKPGSVIENFKFLGYPGGDASKGLQTISLADYYDPCNKRLKLLHLGVAGVWCAPCNQETDAIVAAKSQLETDKIVVLQALDDGKSEGVPATQSDLDFWVMRHMSNFTEMLDPGLQNLSGFFNPASIPWNADIDPRTMEIVSDGVGIETDVSAGLASLPAKPSNPLPVTCP